MQYAVSPKSELQSLSTVASSSNQQTNSTEFEIIFSEDELESAQGNLDHFSNQPKSKERKLSEEDSGMLPPRATDEAMLRPNSKFASKSIIESAKTDQQPLKPMTILGFLQQSVKDKLQGNTKKRVEKAGLKSLDTLTLNASTGKIGSSIPSFTLG
mmetsp:Transcript_2166/g.2484  ORF Transcript_2166/g.2484 Transcript_2166/m.2484 type:complete len:156 (-) Transcript_2166:232-699(-)